MQYSELLLDISLADAADAVSGSVSGLSRTTDDDTVRFRTNSGTTVAYLSDATERGGPARTRLRYRTTMMSPSMATARTKARAVRNALAEYQV